MFCISPFSVDATFVLPGKEGNDTLPIPLMYYVYIVHCADKTFYTGITTDLSRRIKEHNEGIRGAIYTRTRRPVKLLYSKKFRNRSTASKTEYKIKTLSHSQKAQLVARRRLG